MPRSIDPRTQLRKALIVLAKDLASLRKKGLKEQLCPEDALTVSRYLRSLNDLTTRHDADAEKLRQKFVGSSVSEVEEELVKMVAASPQFAHRMRTALLPKEATKCEKPPFNDPPSDASAGPFSEN